MKRRLFAPEVTQTSAMDCGPASLKCMLEGFGRRVSYGRLREACQTDVDGTSIDVIEQVAGQLGLQAEQTMVPLDHLLLPEAGALPAILLVRNADGAVHFVVVWRRVGPFVQIMDPASGRRWVRTKDLVARTFVHAMPVPAEAWREWAGGDAFLGPLRVRMRRVGALQASDELIARAAADPSWRSLATLDAATRLCEAMVAASAVRAGPEAARLLATFFEQARDELDASPPVESCIPGTFWSAGPMAPAEDGEPLVRLRGAVLVRATGIAERRAQDAQEGDAPSLSPELAAALREEPTRPLRAVVAALRADGLLTPALVAAAAATAALGVVVEALVLRGLLGAAFHHGRWEHRLSAIAALASLVALLLCVEAPAFGQALRMGRRLEARLREAFLSKIPRLPDRYFASRPASDMSHRAHAIHVLRTLPQFGFRILRSTADLAITACGLVWLDPRSWPYVLAAALTCLALPLLVQRALVERDLRVRSFDGALTRFYLDALLGVVAVRTHGAGPSVRREHETMLGEFRRAFVGLLSVSTGVDAMTAVVGAVTAMGLLAQYVLRGGDPAGSLLLVYWALSLPNIGADLAASIRQYPELRNTTERLLEPLGALEDEDATSPARALGTADAAAADVRFEGVGVRAAGKTILEDVDVTIPAGTHVAVVGPSGAGKSSLCALLLGWHRASHGRVLVDGAPLRGERLDALRERTAWIDPAIALWNRPLLENIEYGASEATPDLSALLDSADLVGLLQQLPTGMQTPLGDGGALVSGGEGQRVRLARAMRRAGSRLVVLDEPFRGLDREKRRQLLARSRELWKNATLLCVTHDVGETVDFDRVLVIDQGRVVEDGPPSELAGDRASRYRALLDAERTVREELWRNKGWRHVELRAGVLVERHDEGLP
jgi:ATP-binding cassette subfamily B protein